jgi:hypothetical protein
MTLSFPAGDSGSSLKWAIAVAAIIDIPFIAVVVLAEKTSTTILLTSLLPIAVSALIIYSSYAAGKMTYILDEEGMRINFPLSPLRVSYGKIRAAGKVNTTLNLRLFGGSLPGAHWGTFATSGLGNAQVYATRYKGEFVLLELSDGGKVLLTPSDPDAFVEALKAKTNFAAPTLTDVAEPRLDKRRAVIQIAVVTAAWLALIAYVAAIYPGLPDIIPVHFGLDGVPNRYGSKTEMLVLVAISAMFPAMNAFFAVKFGKYNRGLNAFLGFVFILAIGLFAFAVNQMATTV